MQPNDESFPENNIDTPQTVTPPSDQASMPPMTPPAPLNPTPSVDGFSQPSASTPPPPAAFQPPVMETQPLPAETVPPVVDQPKPSGFFGKIKSIFSKK